MVGVVETWLTEQHADAEVCMPGFTIFRSDRQERDGGGVALYLREDMTGDIIAQFDNGTCEMIVVMVHQIDTVVAVCYRPPNTRYGQFEELVNMLDSTLSKLPSPTPNLCWMGDFNLPRSCLVWQPSEDRFLVPIVKGHDDIVDQGVRKLDRQQAQLLIDTASKYCMQQEVSKPTHGGEILELIFTNNTDLVTDILVEDWPDFSDHRLVKGLTNFSLGKVEGTKVEHHLTETARYYKALNFKRAPWQAVKEQLANINWDDMMGLSPADALAYFHEKVLLYRN